jgi:pimeloyl-ACP methyl ester carboxylesterase
MNHNTIDRLGALEIETLVIHGADDLLLSPECGKELAEKITNAELVIYPKASHAVYVEKWSEVCPKLHDFLG